MTNEIEFDKNLWFTIEGCEGKHYLIGNPHTFRGRMHAWCPQKERSFFVSLSEIEEMSEPSKYWITGFLKGNQPEPPTNANGDVDFESAEYRRWTESINLFTQTGYWTSEKRNCDQCGMELLNAERTKTCENCTSE